MTDNGMIVCNQDPDHGRFILGMGGLQSYGLRVGELRAITSLSIPNGECFKTVRNGLVEVWTDLAILAKLSKSSIMMPDHQGPRKYPGTILASSPMPLTAISIVCWCTAMTIYPFIDCWGDPKKGSSALGRSAQNHLIHKGYWRSRWPPFRACYRSWHPPRGIVHAPACYGCRMIVT